MANLRHALLKDQFLSEIKNSHYVKDDKFKWNDLYAFIQGIEEYYKPKNWDSNNKEPNEGKAEILKN